MRYFLLILVLTQSLFAASTEELEKEAFDLLFTEKFVKHNGEITAAKIPFKMKVNQVHSSCSTLQRILSGANMCPVGVEGEVLEFAPEDEWKVTVWGKNGVSNYGEEFDFPRIQHLLDLRKETRELVQKKLAIKDRKFYYSTGTEEEVNKRLYKHRKMHEKADAEEVIVHGVYWANIKPEYEKYERDSDYKGVDIVFVKDERKEAGEAISYFQGKTQKVRQFHKLYK